MQLTTTSKNFKLNTHTTSNINVNNYAHCQPHYNPYNHYYTTNIKKINKLNKRRRMKNTVLTFESYFGEEEEEEEKLRKNAIIRRAGESVYFWDRGSFFISFFLFFGLELINLSTFINLFAFY